MKMEYALSDKAKQQGILAGQELSTHQTLEFSPSEISEKARELWTQLFGSATNVILYVPEIRGGVYSDGSASDQPPKIGEGNRFEADKVLTPSDLEAVLTAIVAKKQALETALPERIEVWQKARQTYEARKKAEAEERAKAEAEQKAKAETQAKRMANLPWVKQLAKKLAVTEEAHSEITRFCQKFTLAPEDLTVQNISDKPYVRLSVTVPVTIAGMERELKITNKTYEQIGEDEYNQYKKPEFSDLSFAIAEALAEIFNGWVQEICNYIHREAYLNVVVGEDTIEVASTDLEADDC